MIQVAAESNDSGGNLGMGFVGVLITIGLITALIFLYRSLRTQLKRIDFDAEGTTDEERMRGRSPQPPGNVNGYHKPSTS